MSITYEQFLSRFPQTPREKAGKGVRVLCPAHNDRNPSLWVKPPSSDSFTVDFKCLAGCKREAILTAKGLTWDDVRCNSHKAEANSSKPSEVIRRQEYTIRNVSGELIATHIRLEYDNGEKSFLWERNGVSGLGGLKVADLPFFNSEKISKHPGNDQCVICEGEKPAAALETLGILSLGTVTGASSAPGVEVLRLVAERPGPVYLWPDNDTAGQKHMERLATQLQALGKPCGIIHWTEAQTKGDAADFVAAGGTLQELEQLVSGAPEWKPAPEEELGGLLANVESFISLYVFTGGAERTALALWVAHTHAIEAAECTPYLYVTSPEKQSGKTRLLEVLALLVARPWFTARVSAAVLVRKVSRDAPTLLLDETDSAFKADKEYSEALRGLLNAGYRRGGVASLCVKKGGDFDLVDFPVFCAKVLSGIGQLPDTVADRSIRINMKRRSPDEPVERFRLRAAQAQASPLRERLERWANVAVTRLADARPVLPEELSDRAADVWEPLLAVADMAGGEWPRRSRQAAGVLSSHADDDGLSWGAQLLRDIALVLDGREGPIPSGELVAALVEREESPWGDLRGRPLNARKLARMLRPYGIRPHTVRLGNATPKGYQAEDFRDAFTRYISGIAATTATQDTSKANSGPGLVADVADKKGIRADDDTPPPPGDLKHNELPDCPTSPCPECGGEWAVSPEGKYVCVKCDYLHTEGGKSQ